MNAPELIALPELEPGPQSSPSVAAPAPAARRKRNGKIARLPRKLRDLINDMLDDGATHAQIAQRLQESTDPPLPYDISERNISGWHTGGYQDWLRHQDHLDLLSAKLDFALDLAQNSQPEKLHELTLQLASIRLCEFLSELALTDPQTDKAMYLRLLSVLPRISREILNLQKFRDASAKAQKLALESELSEKARQEAARDAFLEGIMERCSLVYGNGKYPENPSTSPDPIVDQPSSPAGSPGVPPGPGEADDLPSAISRLPSGLEAAIPSCSQNQTSTVPDASAQPIAIQNSNTDNQPTETYGNLRKDEPASPATNESSTHSEIKNPILKTENPQEFCLECGAPLPGLLPHGARPAKHCKNCKSPLPPPGSCCEPSIEQCPICRANLPRLLPSGQRPSIYCHNCDTPLPV